MGSVPAAWVAYAQGRKAAEDEHDAEVEERLRKAETELTAVRTILQERRSEVKP